MKPQATPPGQDLRAIQRAFATGVTRPLTSARRMQEVWTDGSSAREAVAAFIKPNDRSSSFERLEIYNKQYWFRLLDCLYEDYPGLRTVIGEARFHDLSVAYLTRYPSNTYSLGELGGQLEKFLKQEPHWTETHPALARDVVRLEWAHIRAFDGDEFPPLELDALLGRADPATLRLRFQPYLTFLACDYPVDEFLLAVRRREEPRGEASNAVTERVPRPAEKKIRLPAPQKIFLAVHRSDHSVWYKRLEPEAYLICSALQKGLSLQAACERPFRGRKMSADFTSTLQGWFAQWAAFGWFCPAE